MRKQTSAEFLKGKMKNEKVQNFISKFGFEIKQSGYKIDTSLPYFVMPISSVSGENLKELKFALLEILKDDTTA